MSWLQHITSIHRSITCSTGGCGPLFIHKQNGYGSLFIQKQIEILGGGQSGRDTSAILSRKLVMNQEPLPYPITFECAITLHNVLLFPIPAIRQGIQTWELCSWQKQLILLSPFSFQVPAKMSKDTANKNYCWENTKSLCTNNLLKTSTWFHIALSSNQRLTSSSKLYASQKLSCGEKCLTAIHIVTTHICFCKLSLLTTTLNVFKINAHLWIEPNWKLLHQQYTGHIHPTPWMPMATTSPSSLWSTHAQKKYLKDKLMKMLHKLDSCSWNL